MQHKTSKHISMSHFEHHVVAHMQGIMGAFSYSTVTNIQWRKVREKKEAGRFFPDDIWIHDTLRKYCPGNPPTMTGKKSPGLKKPVQNSGRLVVGHRSHFNAGSEICGCIILHRSPPHLRFRMQILRPRDHRYTGRQCIHQHASLRNGK